MLTDAELRAKAEKRASDIIGFYIHFSCYVSVNVFLFILWWWTNSEYEVFPWPIFTTIGWGVGIIFHFFGVFGKGRLKDRIEEEEFQMLKRKQQGGAP